MDNGFLFFVVCKFVFTNSNGVIKELSIIPAEIPAPKFLYILLSVPRNNSKVENFVLNLQDKLTDLSNRFRGTTKFNYEKHGMRPPHVPAAEWEAMSPEEKKAAYAVEKERKI